MALFLAALALSAGTARLGFWQLDRAAQKAAIEVALAERRDLPPLQGQELAVDAATAEGQYQRHVVLEGRWLGRHTVFLDNRPLHGSAGFIVVTPLLLDDGTAVLVQRGWLRRDAVDRTRVHAPPSTDARVRVSGRASPPPSRIYDFEGAASGPIRQNLDLAAFGAETGLRLRPVSVLQLEPDGAVPDGLVREWPSPASGMHKNYGYAFQWFALSALTFILYVWFRFIRPRRRPAAAH